MIPDSELLTEFARTRSEQAFAELVQRHVNLVYSTALRRVNGDRQLAQDAAQGVFIDLARKAAALAGRQSLAGWFYTSAHFAAAKLVRTEARRRQREETFMNEPAYDPAPEAEWETLRPCLDEVMHELKAGDREAIVMRYFENRPFAEVGAKLGLNENAARMRVDRALDKLRSALLQRGVPVTASLAAVISANAVQLAPAQLAATMAATSLAAVGTGTFTWLNLMTATQLKLGISAMVAAGAATALVVQHQGQVRLQAENRSLTEQVAQLQSDNANLSNRPPVEVSAPPVRPAGDQQAELLRLRGELGVLRHQKADLEGALAKATAATPSGHRAATGAPPVTLPEGYPTTADGATKSLFESLARGDTDALTNFEIDGGSDALNQMTNYLKGVEVVSIGEPTNSFGPNLWFVPYTIRFPDGGVKSFRLHVGEDPATGRWVLKGGI